MPELEPGVVAPLYEQYAAVGGTSTSTSTSSAVARAPRAGNPKADQHGTRFGVIVETQTRLRRLRLCHAPYHFRFWVGVLFFFPRRFASVLTCLRALGLRSPV